MGTITPAQLQAALDRFDLGRLLGAEPARTGNFGQNVFLSTTSGEYVLRGSPHYDWQFPKERFFAALLHEHTTVPVPWPYHLDESTDNFGWSYVLMRRLPGIQLPDRQVYSALTLEDKIGIAAAMGRTLAQLQELTWPHAGEYSLERDAIEPLGVPYRDWVVARIRANLAEALRLSDRSTAADEAWVESILAAADGASDEPFTPCVVHGDFSMHNTVATPAPAGWAITGLFDLMTAYMGDGEADLSRLTAVYLEEDPPCAEVFAREYLRLRPPRPGFAERFALYMLDERLIVWTFALRQSLIWWDQSLSLREWLSRFTAAVPRV